MFIFEPDQKTKETILQPFSKGEYSKIDRDYVEKYYNYTLPDKTRPINYLILTKDYSLKIYWEERIGLSIGDQEVWDRPKPEDEIYSFIKVLHNEVQSTAKI